MKKKIRSGWFWSILAGVLLFVGAYYASTIGRPAPIPITQELHDGVVYHRVVHYLPHSMIAHIIVIDRKKEDVKFIVTPADDVEEGTLKARTTSAFLEEFNVQIAINGDGFFPWWSHSLVDYYPHSGDPVTPKGFSAAFGTVYADGLGDETLEPTLFISRRNELTFNLPPNKIYHAISGDRMLILGGEIVDGLNDTVLHPRTAIGVNRNGRYVILAVVDGRQPFYSNGATFQELARLMKDFGAHYAMALDGGGSSAMVIEGQDGGSLVLNSPIDNYIPGRERPVANHLGIQITW